MLKSFSGIKYSSLILLGVVELILLTLLYIGFSSWQERRHESKPDTSIGESGGGISLSKIGGCVRAGCSGQLCVERLGGEENVTTTTCEYLPEYGCYQMARCERQADGQCGFTQDTALAQCLAEVARQQSAPQDAGINGSVFDREADDGEL